MEEEKTGISKGVLYCRCPDCGVTQARGCNSSRLREMLANIFDGNESLDGASVLYCRRANIRLVEAEDKKGDCPCTECDLKTGGAFYCRSFND